MNMPRSATNISKSFTSRQSGTVPTYSRRTQNTRASYISGSVAPAIYTQPDPKINKGRSSDRVAGRHNNPRTARRQISATQTKTAGLFSPVFKVFVVSLAFLLVIGAACVTLIAGNSIEMQKAEATQAEISKAREEAHSLEVKLGALSNPTRIKGEAESLGMSAATDVVKINLAKDVVVVDDNGSLSLAGSLNQVAK